MKFKFLNKFLSLALITSVLSSSISYSGEQTHTDKNGVITANKKSTFEGKSDEGGTSYLTGLAVGFVTTRMGLKVRPMPTDVMVGVASGAAYTGGEIVSTVQYKKESEKQEVDITVSNQGGAVNEGQKAALEEQKKNAESAKKSIKVKSILQKAAAAGYAVAAGIAVYQSFQEEAMNQACTSAGTAATAELNACASSSSISATEGASCGACSAKVAQTVAEFQAATKARDAGTGGGSAADVSQSTAQRTALQTKIAVPCTGAISQGIHSGVQSACSGALNIQKIFEAMSPTGLISSVNSRHLEKLISNDKSYIEHKIKQFNESPVLYTIGIFFPEAKAGAGSLLSIGAGAAGALGLSMTSIGSYIDVHMANPKKRAIVWGAMAALMAKSSMDSDKIAEDIDKQIEKMGVVVNQMNKMEVGIKTQNLSENKLDISDMLKGTGNAVSFSTDGNEKFPCLVKNGTSNCTSLDDQFGKTSLATELDPSLMNLGSSVTKLGDTIQGSSGITGSSLQAANNIGKNSNAINRKMNQAMAELSRIQRKNGTPQTDILGETEKFSKAVNSRIANAIKNGGGSGFMLGKNGSGGVDSKQSSPGGSLNHTGSGIRGVANIPPVGKDPAQKSLNLKFLEDKKEGVLNPNQDVANNENLDISLEDIHKDSSASIFEIISNRYIRSGYPKLLEEDL